MQPAGAACCALLVTFACGVLAAGMPAFHGTALCCVQASDHTRRLVSVKANSKFSHPDAGPTFPLNVSLAGASCRPPRPDNDIYRARALVAVNTCRSLHDPPGEGWSCGKQTSAHSACAAFCTKPLPAVRAVQSSHPQEDLKGVVAHLKQQYGLRYVFAWHAMGGFWGGLSAGEREMQRYQARLVMPVPSPSLLVSRATAQGRGCLGNLAQDAAEERCGLWAHLAALFVTVARELAAAAAKKK